MGKQVCLKCRSSVNVRHLSGGDWGCTACKIRFHRASIKAYNRLSRLLRLYGGEETYIHKTGEYMPSGKELGEMIDRTWQDWDGQDDILSNEIPF